MQRADNIGTKALAGEAGVHPVTVSGWRRGRRPRAQAQYVWLANRLKVGLKWLKSAEGEMTDAPPSAAASAAAMPGARQQGDLQGERSEAVDRARTVAGEIILDRLAGRMTIPVSDAMAYLAAVVEAAAGRPVRFLLAPDSDATPAELAKAAADATKRGAEAGATLDALGEPVVPKEKPKEPPRAG